MSSFQQKLAAWLLANHGVVANFEPVFGNVGWNGTEITRFPYIEGVSMPTIAQIEAVDAVALERARVKARYVEVRDTLFLQEPKFALVFLMIKYICINHLSMTEEQYDTACQSVFNTWVDGAYT